MGQAGYYMMAVNAAGSEEKLRADLLKYRKKEGSWAEVARQFGVSRQTMLQWRWRLGIQ